MYANLALSIYLSMQTGPVAASQDSQPVPIFVELQTEQDADGANVKVGKRVVVLAQVNEEEEETEKPRVPKISDRGRNARERAAEFQLRREDSPERRPRDAHVGQRYVDRGLNEQTERIERLEGEVRRLNEIVERMQRNVGGREMPRVTATLRGSDRRDRSSRDPNPEVRVRALEEALAKMKERAGGSEDTRSQEVRRAVEARKEAERRRVEESRNRLREQASQMLNQVREKRAEAKKAHEQQREAVARQMKQAMERLEQNFKQSDAQLEKAIAELEKKLGESKGEKRR